MPDKSINLVCVSNAFYNGKLVKKDTKASYPEADAKQLIASKRFALVAEAPEEKGDKPKVK